MKRIITCTLILISLYSGAQTIFANVREGLLVGSFKNSLVQLDSCIATNYQKDSALYHKGLVYFKINNLKEANANCSLLFKSFPNFAEAHYLSGLIFLSEKNYDKSITEFNLVIAKHPNHLNALFNRASAFGASGNYKKCIADLNTCISAKPMYMQAYFERAYWKEYMGERDGAIKDYQTTINLDPKNFEAYIDLAYIYRKQKENVKCCELLNNAIMAGSQMAEELKEMFCK